MFVLSSPNPVEIRETKSKYKIEIKTASTNPYNITTLAEFEECLSDQVGLLSELLTSQA